MKNSINLENLTELDYLYYSVGFLYYKEQEQKNYNQLIEYFGYQVADLKTLLYDISSCVRGIGGIKKSFDVKLLPSNKEEEKIIIETNENETPEERLERHKKFFQSLKSLAN